MKRWERSSDDQLWDAVKEHCDLAVANVSASVIDDLSAERPPEESRYTARTEGGRKIVLSSKIERDPKLRDEALRIHGTTCQACGFSFESRYGHWGKGFAIVHHAVALSDFVNEHDTDPKKDLVVVCANCHAMIHRRKGVVLTIEDLRSRLR